MANPPDMAAVLGAPLAEYLADKIPNLARRRHDAYSRIPADDYEQAMWVEVIGKPKQFKRFHEEGRRGLIYFRLNKACRQLMHEDQRFQRSAKAAAAGYSVNDEEFYSTGLLAHMLPALIAAEFDPAEAMVNATTGTDAAGIHIRSSDPFGGAENYQVILIDICAAWEQLTEGQRRLLRAYYRADQEDTQDGRWERQSLAGSMGLTEDALRQRAHRALLALSEKLGGESPWR